MESKKNQLNLYDLVKTYDLETIPPINPSEEGWRFRIEILKRCNSEVFFFPRVCRRESYYLSPAFIEETEDDNFDKTIQEIIVLDTSRNWSEMKGNNPEDVLNLVLNEIYNIFGLNGPVRQVLDSKQVLDSEINLSDQN